MDRTFDHYLCIRAVLTIHIVLQLERIPRLFIRTKTCFRTGVPQLLRLVIHGRRRLPTSCYRYVPFITLPLAKLTRHIELLATLTIMRHIDHYNL